MPDNFGVPGYGGNSDQIGSTSAALRLYIELEDDDSSLSGDPPAPA